MFILILFNETKFDGLTWRDFSRSLCELLSKTDKIEKAAVYVDRYIEPYQDTAAKRREYARHPKIKEIKKDINDFTLDWSNRIKSKDGIKKVDVNPSTWFGLSEYVYLDIGFTNPKLQGFYDEHPEKYNRVKFRFTDHGDVEEVADQKSDDQVEYEDRSFLQAAKEMEDKIDTYLNDLHNEERSYLKKLKNKERRKRRKYNQKLKKLTSLNAGLNGESDTKDSDVSKNTSESLIRLRIREDDLNESLEEIASGTYCTDYVGDIVNWLLNKPKPYRILYDKKYDVWCIADAMQNTHKDMSIDLFDSDYLYGVTDDLDGDIKRFREEGNFNDGYTDAEVYSEWLFDNRLMKGCFFIPKNMNYRDYEESGFYSVNIPITTGDIFVTRASEFSPSGIFSDMYNKLLMRGAIRKSLKQIWLDLRRKKMDDIDDIVDIFHSEAEKNGYSDEEATEFLNRFGIVSLMNPV